MKLNHRTHVFVLALAFLVIASARLLVAQETVASLRPLMNVPGEIVYSSSDAVSGVLNKQKWQARQGTQWKVVDGVLRGQQSSPEFQAKKKDHKGLEPRVKSLVTPREFIARFSVRFIDGEETNLLPLIEFGHHNVRLKFSESGVVMLADHEAIQLAETQELKLESGRWYHVLAERNGDEFVIQFAGGPTLYAKHKSLAIPVADEKDGLGIAGTRKGLVEIENVELWDIKPGTSPGWKAARKRLPTVEAKPIAKKKKSK